MNNSHIIDKLEKLLGLDYSPKEKNQLIQEWNSIQKSKEGVNFVEKFQQLVDHITLLHEADEFAANLLVSEYSRCLSENYNDFAIVVSPLQQVTTKNIELRELRNLETQEQATSTKGGHRYNFSQQAVAVMKNWLLEHLERPYPTVEERDQLAAETNLQPNQVKDWFINARRRILPKLNEENGPRKKKTPKRNPSMPKNEMVFQEIPPNEQQEASIPPLNSIQKRKQTDSDTYLLETSGKKKKIFNSKNEFQEKRKNNFEEDKKK